MLDRKVAAENLKIFAADMAKSLPLTLAEFESRPAYIKLADHLCGMFRSQF